MKDNKLINDFTDSKVESFYERKSINYKGIMIYMINFFIYGFFSGIILSNKGLSTLPFLLIGLMIIIFHVWKEKDK